MDDRVETLRARIDRVRRGTDGRRVFTAAIRKEAAELAREWDARGRQQSVLADALGLNRTTLFNWSGKTRQRAKVRKVEVQPEPVELGFAEPHRASGLALQVDGFRVDGLTLPEVIELVRALR